MAKKKAKKKKPQIVLEQLEAARILGTTDRTLRRWMKRPDCPDCSNGYDIEALREFQQSISGESDEQRKKAIELNLITKEEEAKQKQLKTREMQRQEKIAEGDLLPRSEYQLFTIEQISASRDMLLAIPLEMRKHVCRKCQAKMKELEKQINTALHRLSRLPSGPTSE